MTAAVRWRSLSPDSLRPVVRPPCPRGRGRGGLWSRRAGSTAAGQSGPQQPCSRFPMEPIPVSGLAPPSRPEGRGGPTSACNSGLFDFHMVVKRPQLEHRAGWWHFPG